MTHLVTSESSQICVRCDGEGGKAEITNVPWRTAKSLGLGYWVCPICAGRGTNPRLMEIEVSETPRLHPASWQQLHQLVKLHGATAIIAAVGAIKEEQSRENPGNYPKRT